MHVQKSKGLMKHKNIHMNGLQEGVADDRQSGLGIATHFETVAVNKLKTKTV